jgi:spore maturation protein CgeB
VYGPPRIPSCIPEAELPPTILFCAHLASVSYASRQRFETLGRLGCRMQGFDTEPLERRSLAERAAGRLRGSAFGERALRRFEDGFLAHVRGVRPDVVWIERGVLARPDVLREARHLVPRAVFVSYQVDNPFGTRAHERPLWTRFIESIPEYDVHFVLRRADLESYRVGGAQAVELTRHHYLPGLHAPQSTAAVSPERRHDVVFVGTAVDTRIRRIGRLMAERSLDVHVYGGLWGRHPVRYRHPSRFHGRVDGEHYAALVAGSRIALGYVSASNRDEYTHRSIEIPACGGFFLGERTATHAALYEEGAEAEFFETDRECLDKIRYYLAHEADRRRIAEAGHRRCLRSRLACADVMTDVLAAIGQEPSRSLAG